LTPSFRQRHLTSASSGFAHVTLNNDDIIRAADYPHQDNVKRIGAVDLRARGAVQNGSGINRRATAHSVNFTA
jgi:hypothetical protein